jgi:hypothetical protein
MQGLQSRQFECYLGRAAMKAVLKDGKGVSMHLVKEYIREMAQDGAKVTNEAHLHLKQCGDCGNLFRLFVLYRFYTERQVHTERRSVRRPVAVTS